MCYSVKMDHLRLKNGFEILMEVNKLAIAFVENNCFLVPSKDPLYKVDRLYEMLELKGGNRDYKTAANSLSDEVGIAECRLSEESRVSRYNKFLLNSGISSKELIKMIFKIQDDFEFNSIDGRIVISGDCEFLAKYGDFISKKLTKLNSRFEKDLKKAEKKRDKLLAESAKVGIEGTRIEVANSARDLINDIKKEQFVI